MATTPTTTMSTVHDLALVLTSVMRPTDTALPVTPADAARVSSALGSTRHAWLTISDPTGSEVVRATAWNGQVLVDRAQDGSIARTFPAGACVDSRVTYAGLKDLLCNYNCCATGDCTQQL